MAGLTPEEQHFFDSGGDTSKLIPEPVAEAAPPPTPVDLAGLSNNDPAPIQAPAAPPVVAAPAAPVVTPPAPDPSEFLRQSLSEAQQRAADLAAQLEAARAATKPHEQPVPDPNTDPLGSMLHQLDQVNKSVSDLQTQLANQQTQQQQLAAFNTFRSQVVALRDQFAKDNPDFQDAYNHLRENRMADLRTFGLPEPDVARQIFQEEMNLSQAALQQGKNPAAALYDMAKRHGYTPKAAAPVAPPKVPVAPPTAKLPGVKTGVESAPANLPRTPVTEEITVESLREASDTDLNKLVSDPNAWAKIAGKDHIPL